MPIDVIYGLWLAWVVSWLVAAVWTAPTAVRPPAGAQAPYRIVQTLGALALFFPRRTFTVHWPVSPAVGWAMAALVLAGFALSWWARIHLGRLWSGTVQRKEGHRVIDTGPYRLVRHPIYTGLILAAFATAIARQALAPLLGACLLTLAFYMKAQLEEQLLRRELGEDAYDAYARRTPMLAPLPRV